jgi:CheY-like chemotaxis protein
MPSGPVVLVVDDDPDVRELLVSTLESEGMIALEAASGAEALRILEADPSVCFLFTDILMPGISGTILADKAAQIRPDLKIALTTAFAVSVPNDGRPLLRKPFDIDELTRMIRAMCSANT